jgi:4-hydroxybenzoyl-CoA thioesterase
MTNARGVPVTYFVRRGQVAIAWPHCDPAGIVFYGRFFEFFDHSTWTLFEEVLATKAHEIPTRFDIIGFPVVDLKARFFKPLTYGVVVDIETTIREFRKSSFDVLHRLFVAQELAVEAVETRVWTGRDRSAPGKIRGIPLPPAVIERFRTA